MPARRSKAKADTGAVGSVFAAPVEGGFAACQIVRRKGTALLVVALDWYGKAAPTLAELGAAPALILTHHFWRGGPQALWVGSRLPREWQWLGRLPAVSVGTINSHGHAEAVPFQIPLQWHWDHCIPAEARQRFEACKAAGAEGVEIALGPLRANLRRATHKLSIGPGKQLDVPLGEGLNWQALEALGCLSEIDYSGADAGIVGLLERAPIIRSLSWQQHGRDVIDVRSLDLDQLIVDHSQPLTILADRLATLTVLGSGDGVTVTMPTAEKLHLRLSGKGSPRLPIAGLEGLARKLELQHFDEIAFAAIANHPDLTELAIFAGPRARFRELKSLRQLTKLRTLTIREGYGLDASVLADAELPPSLDHVVIRGYTKEHGEALRALFGSVARFEIAGAREASELEATLSNPFDWSGIDPRESSRATKAWADAVTGLRKAKSKPERSAVLRKFVTAFNGIHKRGVIPIAGARAAEVEEAFAQLSDRAKLKPQERAA
ncbi:MAG: hypothetical protein JNK04_22530, partial [Myxococcales bacterium]|nr:hypothetical protein [Myxococcales bacterium]